MPIAPGCSQIRMTVGATRFFAPPEKLFPSTFAIGMVLSRDCNGAGEGVRHIIIERRQQDPPTVARRRTIPRGNSGKQEVRKPGSARSVKVKSNKEKGRTNGAGTESADGEAHWGSSNLGQGSSNRFMKGPQRL